MISVRVAALCVVLQQLLDYYYYFKPQTRVTLSLGRIKIVRTWSSTLPLLTSNVKIISGSFLDKMSFILRFRFDSLLSASYFSSSLIIIIIILNPARDNSEGVKKNCRNMKVFLFFFLTPFRFKMIWGTITPPRTLLLQKYSFYTVITRKGYKLAKRTPHIKSQLRLHIYISSRIKKIHSCF